MSLIVKTGKYAFLKNLGVSEVLLLKLAGLGIKIALGEYSCSFLSKDNTELEVVTLPATSLMLSTPGGAAPDLKMQAKVSLEAAIIGIIKSPLVKEKPKEYGTPDPVTLVIDMGSGDAPKFASKPVSEIPGVILLRDATELYQRVKGTSPGSVYVTVAVSDSIKVAAKVKGNKLSVRVESPQMFTAGTLKAFNAQGLSDTHDGKYMSGHYSCTNVTPDRVLGAVLVACGVKFNTPLPDMSKVKALSAG